MKITITKEIELTNQMIDDIMITAFEGGINYWCINAKFADKRPSGIILNEDGIGRTLAEMLSQGYDLIVQDDECVDHLLTLETFRTGLQKWLQDGGDLDNYDANDADSIIQYAIYRELVYG